MRTLMLLALFAGVAFAQEPSRPFPNHERPPEGWFCVPARNAKDVATDPHACECRGMFMDDPTEHCKTQPIVDEEGNPTGETFRPESSKCKAFCHKDSCTCSKRCEDS